ncbi:RNA polymerase III subunit G [Rhynchophorus ferrugineus]|uniref:RNA polymerase III subunit G n=1 Tax=Rhynchophorus ferrugineus TaxID=354439 RepID=UPI003FCD1F9C
MSRGRGGRGGRGGSNKTFTRDQLNDLGIGAKDAIPAMVTQPPPLYPLMDRKPLPFTPSVETDYLLILRQDFIDHMQLSPSYLKLPVSKTANQPEQEIDKLVAQIPSAKEKYDWSLFPSELRPKALAKRLKNPMGKQADINIQEKLTELEKIEESKGVVVKEEELEAEEEELAMDEDDQDEEMDEGTDYANNYFDNGEAYEDEDDNLDEGPIY